MMRRFALFPAMLLAAPLAISGMGVPIALERATLAAEAVQPARKKRRAAYRAADGRYRSKNAPTRRKLRSNRLHVSRRVRRKHRRAA